METELLHFQFLSPTRCSHVFQSESFLFQVLPVLFFYVKSLLILVCFPLLGVSCSSTRSRPSQTWWRCADSWSPERLPARASCYCRWTTLVRPQCLSTQWLSSLHKQNSFFIMESCSCPCVAPTSMGLMTYFGATFQHDQLHFLQSLSSKLLS